MHTCKNNAYTRIRQYLPLLPALLLLMLSLTCAQAGADSTGADVPAHPQIASIPLLDFYQAFISRADGQRCPMVPTCSQYAQQAFRRYGFIKGWVLACDRLLRCGHDEIRLAPVVRIEGTPRAYDPLGANTFWWEKN